MDDSIKENRKNVRGYGFCLVLHIQQSCLRDADYGDYTAKSRVFRRSAKRGLKRFNIW